MQKTHSNHTILTTTKENLDFRLERFGLNSSYPQVQRVLESGELNEERLQKEISFEHRKSNKALCRKKKRSGQKRVHFQKSLKN